MLASLEINNYLLIKKIKINFDNGFNAFTGETGAGKSIIIEGLKLALGNRNFKDLEISKDKNVVFKIVFNLNEKTKEKLNYLDMNIEEDYIIVKREINHEMKSKIYINDELTTQNQVRKISDKLIEIQDNYEQQELFNNKYFLEYIDKLANLNKEELHLKYKNFIDSKKEYISQYEKKDLVDKEIKYLEQNLTKLQKLNPTKDEYKELTNKKNLHKNKKTLLIINQELLGLLNNHEENSEIYNGIVKNLEKLSKIDKKYNEFNNIFNEAYYNFSEILNNIKNDISIDEEQMMSIEEIENRIFSYNNLSKLIQLDPEDLYESYNKLKDEIENLKNFENNLKRLKKNYDNYKEIFISKAREISIIRKKKSLLISKEINFNLPLVNIEQGEIRFDFIEKSENDFSTEGIDEIDVGFRTNKKMGFYSIKKVASGGELSRLLLIMKSITTDKDKTIIFDEVDSGLSGKVAGVVADKIMEISKYNQVLAITHSPQVAAKAEKHWKIEKNVNSNNTMESKIIELEKEDRIEEIANIFSGSKVSEASRKVAKDLLLKH